MVGFRVTFFSILNNNKKIILNSIMGTKFLLYDCHQNRKFIHLLSLVEFINGT